MGCKILLADDSITIQKVVNLTFDDEGIEVVAVSNGDHAERKLGEVNPDLVLADIFMPGKNGYELCESIKQNPQYSNVPVVLLVGAFEPFDQNEARRVGADDHLTKPFESRKLVETVRRLISIREQTRPKQPPAVTAPQQGSGRSERATDSLDDRSEKTTDPLDPKPFAGGFDLDMSGAPGERAPVETAAPGENMPGSASERTALNENAPLDLDYSTTEQSPDASQESAFQFSPPEATGDLSTESFNDEIAFETTPLEDLEFPVNNQSSHVMFEADDARSQAESSEQAPQPFSFGENTVDFDKLDASEPLSSDMVFAIDVDARDTAEPSTGRQTLEWASDTPAWQASLHEPSRFDSGGSTYAAGEASEGTSAATLLAVEDPLGDVLMDEATAQQPVLEGRWQPTETIDEPELNLDFASREAAPLPPLSEAAPEYAASHMEESATLTDAPADVEQSSVEQAPFEQATVEQATVEQALVEHELVFNPQDEPQAAEVSQTEGAESHSDFGQVVEPGFEAVSDETQSSAPATTNPMHATGAEFTSSAMWTEEDSRFAPIDIEAVPVDEAELQRAGQPRPLEQETGFEFSQIITEEPDTGLDYLIPAEGQQTVGQPPEGESEPTGASQSTSQVIDLSQSAIDEIVRRVVAELSDRVVREIAWEVVPDLVERVVEKLARESISKRM